MWVTKNTAMIPNPEEVVSALVMPCAGHTDDEVMTSLRQASAEVSPLAQGFLSVRASRSLLKSIETIARVELKATKQFH